ncbi:zinc finger protein 862-like [Bufo bufo]|uniref:zinc finger protein 862-like n=1 Tax=Bufo bufo TaxID=8384 RepID=UPI001ABE3A8A|nr:zinc finger protein 862-like [Bufo bufo]
MNASMHSVQDIHDHMAKYLAIPQSWRGKNYAFEFVECINETVQAEMMAELRSATFHTLVVDESTDISVSKMLILYAKFRPFNTDVYKTIFAGITKLTSCDSGSVTDAIKQFYSDNHLDLQKMVMFTSDGASVMLGKQNGVAACLRNDIPHLLEQHCVAHREDLGIEDACKKVSLMGDIEMFLRTVYTMFSRSSVKKAEFKELSDVLECETLSFKALNEKMS